MQNADQFGYADTVGPPPTPSAPASPPGDGSAPPGDGSAQSQGLGLAVRAAQGGDEEAFRLVFRTVQPLLLRYLRVLVGGDGSLASDAEDIASETWLQITRDLHTFHGDGDGFRGWAATIARHRALDHLRARRRRPTAELPEEYLSELPAREDTEGSALATVGTQQALAMIAGLPKDQAEAVLLRVVLQLDAESAARVLGKRAGSVRMAAHRGLRRLAKLLESSDAVPPRHGPSKRLEKKSAEGVTQPGASTLKDMR